MIVQVKKTVNTNLTFQFDLFMTVYLPTYLPTYLPMYMKYLAIGLRDCLCLESHKIYMP